MLRESIVAIAVVTSASAALAQSGSPVVLGTPEGGIMLTGKVGYTFISGNELVYNEFGDRISHLFWDTHAPVVEASACAEIGRYWTVSGRIAFAFSGKSHMEDYDWVGPHFRSYDFADWTLQSVHPDTRLRRYIELDLALGRDIALSQSAAVNLHGGFSYTNVAWDAYGGSFLYSDLDFRDWHFERPPGVGIISFEQRYPGIFLGATIDARHERWSFSGTLRAGVTIGATDTDFHWRRNLRFEETYGAIPFASIQTDVGYNISSRVKLIASGRYQRYFHKVGDTTMFAIDTGNQLGPTSVDGAGMSLGTASATLGLKIAF